MCSAYRFYRAKLFVTDNCTRAVAWGYALQRQQSKHGDVEWLHVVDHAGHRLCLWRERGDALHAAGHFLKSRGLKPQYLTLAAGYPTEVMCGDFVWNEEAQEE